MHSTHQIVIFATCAVLACLTGTAFEIKARRVLAKRDFTRQKDLALQIVRGCLVSVGIVAAGHIANLF